MRSNSDRSRAVVAVWKEKLTLKQSEEAARKIMQYIAGDEFPFDVVLAPNPFCYASVARIVKDTPIQICAQNVLWHRSQGSFIAETTTDMLLEIGCRYAIVGHSERRLHFGESDNMIAERALAAAEAGLVPIVCIGDTGDDRDSGRSDEKINCQLQNLFDVLDTSMSFRDLILAYEPVWAISTWRSKDPLPTGAAVQEIHAHIRELIAQIKGADWARGLSLLYGGSVAPENATEYMVQSDVDGALVGGASKTAESFVETLREAKRGFESR